MFLDTLPVFSNFSARDWLFILHELLWIIRKRPMSIKLKIQDKLSLRYMGPARRLSKCSCVICSLDPFKAVPGIGSGLVDCTLDCLFTLLLSLPYAYGRGWPQCGWVSLPGLVPCGCFWGLNEGGVCFSLNEPDKKCQIYIWYKTSTWTSLNHIQIQFHFRNIYRSKDNPKTIWQISKCLKQVTASSMSVT